MDDTDFTIDVLTILLQEAPVLLKELQEATVLANAASVREKAHKLKSSAAMINAVELNCLLDGIEEKAKQCLVDNDLFCIVENAIHQYQQIETLLKIHLQQLKDCV